MSEMQPFTEKQKQYLAGFTMGADVARTVRGLPVLSSSGAGIEAARIVLGPNGNGAPKQPEAAPLAVEPAHAAAQDRVLAAGGKLAKEEQAKRKKNPLDMWDELEDRAADGQWPKGTDVFLTKFHGLFYVAPAQDAYMCRLRIPGGAMTADQLRGVADLSERYAGGYADVTTRANLQLREIGPRDGVNVLMGLRDLGLVNLGAGGDNIRNVTASPLSGIDPDELIETLPLARRMHHYILNHREMYGLPRKFNIAYDGGGRISAVDDTNDIGFHAVRVGADQASEDLPAGVYFALRLGGITGHRDFARETGVLLEPGETVRVAAAIVRVFLAHGDRTDRNKARLKYLLDEWGFEKFLAEVEQEHGRTLRRVSADRWERPDREDRQAHLGVHLQRQPGLHYVGIVTPVGRLTSEQMRGVAGLAERFGDRSIRLTVWQNLLISGVPADDLQAVQDGLVELGLDWRASRFQAGLVACTGNAGCKYAAANTKRHASELAEFLQQRIDLDSSINIHVTGCHHSCAQHYIGDIGLLATKVERDDDMVEGYHVHVGGGWGRRQGIARLLFESVPFDELPALVLGLVGGYLENRSHAGESFAEFAVRTSDEELRSLASVAA